MRRLGWNLLAAVAFVLGMAWAPDETGTTLLIAAITVAIAEWLATWWFGRVLGVIALGSALLSAATVRSLAVESTTFDGLFTIHDYDHDRKLLVITCVGIALLLAMSLRRIFGRR